MKRSFLSFVLVVLFLGPVWAHGYKIGALDIAHPWTRATPKGAAIAGGYLSITNKGTTPDRLVGGSLSIADRLEIHEMKMQGTVMQMRPLPAGLEIKPGATVELKPGSFHLMFMGLKEPVVVGKRVKGTLVFEKAGTIEVEYAVEPVGQTPGHPNH